ARVRRARPRCTPCRAARSGRTDRDRNGHSTARDATVERACESGGVSLAQRKPTGILAALRHVRPTSLVRSVVSAAYRRRTLVGAGVLCLALASVAGVSRLS